jgi:hypothetical protein
MKDFIYLVQGKAELLSNYVHLLDRPKADVIFLTYDRPIDRGIFFPNSTWAQGRNKLLEAALNEGEYLYYVFCDDDIKFIKGNWDIFENQILKYKPAIAVPVNPKTIQTPIPGLQYQSFVINDEQLIAFHRDVVRDSIVLPYQTQFDNIFWWVSCLIQQLLVQNFYTYNTIQFNNIYISNDAGTNYAKPETQSDRKKISELSDDWLSKQFLAKYKEIPSLKRRPMFILARTINYHLQRITGTAKYSVDVKRLKELLSADSDLYIQSTKLKEKFDRLRRV